MYTLLNARAVENGIYKRWHSVDSALLATLSVKNALDHYRVFHIRIQNGALPAYWANLGDAAQQQYANTQNLTSWLSSQSVHTFTALQIGELSSKAASYSIASQAGYRANTWNSDPNSQERPDLLLTREVQGMDYQSYNANCLTSVSGLFHYTEPVLAGTSYIGVRIVDGAKTVKRSKASSIGVWSFHGISNLQKHRITLDMIAALSNPGNGIYAVEDNLVLTLPAAAVNKYIMLVIAGHLCFGEQGDFTYMANNKLLLRLNQVETMFDKYYAANSILDISSVNNIIKQPQISNGAVVSPVNEHYITRANLLSEAGLKAMLTLPQSFIVAFDKPMYISKSEILNGLNGILFRTAIKPNAPVLGLSGICPEYWTTKEKHGYSIRLAVPRNRIINKNDHNRTVAVSQPPELIDPDMANYDGYTFRQRQQSITLLEMGSDWV